MEFDHNLWLKILIPWHDELGHLAERRQRARANEEEVGQVNLCCRTYLIDLQGGIITSHVHIGEAPFEDDVACVGRQTYNFFANLLMPAILSVELDLRKRGKSNIDSHKLSTFVSCKSVSFSTFNLELQLLTDLDELAFEVFVSSSH